MLLERFDGYWKDEWKALVDRLVILVMPDVAARQAALRAGEAHIVIAPEPDSLSKLEEEGFVVSKGPMPHIWTVSFNEHEEAFADERVRMAVHHAMDREGMAHQLLQGTALPGESWLSRTSEAYKASDRWHAYDPARARALLEEAGALGTRLVFATSTSGSGQMQPVKMAEWIQRNLNDAGFDAEIELMEWNAYIAKFFEGFDPEWSLVQMSWGWTAAYWLDMFLNPGNQPDGMMDIGVADEITAAHQMTDPAAANEAYHAVAERVRRRAGSCPSSTTRRRSCSARACGTIPTYRTGRPASSRGSGSAADGRPARIPEDRWRTGPRADRSAADGVSERAGSPRGSPLPVSRGSPIRFLPDRDAGLQRALTWFDSWPSGPCWRCSRCGASPS